MWSKDEKRDNERCGPRMRRGTMRDVVQDEKRDNER